jgi:hypothetical protein
MTELTLIPKFVVPTYNSYADNYDDYLEQVMDALANHYNKYVVGRLNSSTVQVADPFQLLECLHTLKDVNNEKERQQAKS